MPEDNDNKEEEEEAEKHEKQEEDDADDVTPALAAAAIPSSSSLLPPSMYYIPNFISAAEEQQLLQKISRSPLPHWTQLRHRRVQSHPSALLARSSALVEAALPGWLATPIVGRLEALGVFGGAPHGGPNHVLVNEYAAGQGIAAHEDGPAYHPVTATVGLGSHAVLELRAKGEEGGGREWRVLQERRSLLVTCGRAYRETLHGIDGVVVDEGLEGCVNWGMRGEIEGWGVGGRRERGTRVSLTFRDVLRVRRVGGLGGLVGRR